MNRLLQRAERPCSLIDAEQAQCIAAAYYAPLPLSEADSRQRRLQTAADIVFRDDRPIGPHQDMVGTEQLDHAADNRGGGRRSCLYRRAGAGGGV